MLSSILHPISCLVHPKIQMKTRFPLSRRAIWCSPWWQVRLNCQLSRHLWKFMQTAKSFWTLVLASKTPIFCSRRSLNNPVRSLKSKNKRLLRPWQRKGSTIFWLREWKTQTWCSAICSKLNWFSKSQLLFLWMLDNKLDKWLRARQRAITLECWICETRYLIWLIYKLFVFNSVGQAS